MFSAHFLGTYMSQYGAISIISLIQIKKCSAMGQKEFNVGTYYLLYVSTRTHRNLCLVGTYLVLYLYRACVVTARSNRYLHERRSFFYRSSFNELLYSNTKLNRYVHDEKMTN